MDCCCKSKFWIGLGLGTLLGAACYHYSRSKQAQEFKNTMYDAMHKAGDKAGEMWQTAKNKMAGTCNSAIEDITD